jgi:hypothetical protein
MTAATVPAFESARRSYLDSLAQALMGLLFGHLLNTLKSLPKM